MPTRKQLCKDNSFSPKSNPDLVLAFGTQTMDCGGEINGSPQGVMLAHKNSPNRLIASYVGQRAPNSQSFECRSGQLVAPFSDTVLACQQCVPATCPLKGLPPGDIIENGELSVIPQSGKLDSFGSDGGDHVLLGTMVHQYVIF